MTSKFSSNLIIDKGVKVIIKKIPDRDFSLNFDPRVYKVKLEEKPNQNLTSIQEIRESMGWDNIDVSRDIVTSEKYIEDVFVKIYSPKNIGDKPCFIFLHGGGFIGGSLKTVENPCKALSMYANAHVVSVDYRLAPENPYPNGLEDIKKVFEYLVHNQKKLGINKFAVSGDSAGGNLALALAQYDSLNKRALSLVAPIYPVVDLTTFDKVGDLSDYKISDYKDRLLVLDSINELGKGSSTLLQKYYLNGDIKLAYDENVSPIFFSHKNLLPKTVIVNAEFDGLRIEAENYARMLASEGVDVTTIMYEGVDHAFIDKIGLYPQAEDCMIEIANALD